MATASISNSALDFSRANLLVFDAQQQTRTIVRDMARRMGFAVVRVLGRFEELADILAASDYELIILCADDRISDVCDLVRRIRHGEIGQNPFAVTILTSVSVTENEAGQMVNSGADTVIFKPFSADGLFQRVATLVRARKPFVATPQYVGPDRRDGERHVGDIPLIEVPNTLAGSVNKSSEDMLAAIAEAKKTVVTQQAGRLVVEMKLIIDGLVADAQSGELTAERCATAAAALAASLEKSIEHRGLLRDVVRQLLAATGARRVLVVIVRGHDPASSGVSASRSFIIPSRICPLTVPSGASRCLAISE